MEQISDAPYIRKAERDGVGYMGPEVKCPICYEECETLYIQERQVIGCEHCVETVDAYDWIFD